MHNLAMTHDFAAEDLSDRLVSEADTKKRRIGFCGGLGQRQADACLVRVTRTGA